MTTKIINNVKLLDPLLYIYLNISILYVPLKSYYINQNLLYRIFAIFEYIYCLIVFEFITIIFIYIYISNIYGVK